VRTGGKTVGGRELVVGAGKSAAATIDGLALNPLYEAVIENRDALELDNRRFAVAPGSAKLRILAISPRPQELASLRALPGISLDVIAPADYGKTEHSAYGLEIFHFAAPAMLPRAPALLILPPNGGDLVEVAAPVAGPSISGWRDAHVLTRYVNFALFRPPYARPLKAKTPANVIVESAQGPLALAIERRGTRQLILGFDPFPYLGRENLPMSIFTLNFIDWFSREWGGNDKATGEPFAVSAADRGKAIETPKGSRTVSDTGAFAETYYQGFYQIPHGSEKVNLAVNLQDAGESDLRSPPVIDVSGNESASGRLQTLVSYWPYLLLAALALLLLEWFAHPRQVAAKPRIS
jgi:hypothetical protein